MEKKQDTMVQRQRVCFQQRAEEGGGLERAAGFPDLDFPHSMMLTRSHVSKNICII